jgi:hypothetical protein
MTSFAVNELEIIWRAAKLLESTALVKEIHLKILRSQLNLCHDYRDFTMQLK